MVNILPAATITDRESCGLSVTVLVQASVRQGDSAPPPPSVRVKTTDATGGKRFVGSARWRTETVTLTPAPGQPPELAVLCERQRLARAEATPHLSAAAVVMTITRSHCPRREYFVGAVSPGYRA
jgi:hypothetical protein